MLFWGRARTGRGCKTTCRPNEVLPVDFFTFLYSSKHMNEAITADAPLWAVVCVLLGTGQVMAAMIGVIGALPSGANVNSVGAVTMDLALTLSSVVLFRDSRR
jgi:hypothetical protein